MFLQISQLKDNAMEGKFNSQKIEECMEWSIFNPNIFFVGQTPYFVSCYLVYKIDVSTILLTKRQHEIQI